MSKILFVGGAGGQLGQLVIGALKERGFDGKLIAGTRDPGKLANLSGVTLRQADYRDVAGLTAALEGVDTFLLISTDTIGQRLPLHLNALAAAKEANVKHIVYTSMVAPEAPSAIPFAPEHAGTEEAIKRSGIPYTILRMNWYADILLGSLPGSLKSGQWFSSAGAGRVSYVTRSDCARAAAGAMLQPAANATYTVTGPDALTTDELAAIASEVTGRPLTVIHISDEQLAAGSKAAGVPDGVVDNFIVPLDRNTREGKAGVVTDAVETLWGTRPTSVRDFLASNKAALLA
jgi:NAD(P)H dehydrogenase (quinone)